MGTLKSIAGRIGAFFRPSELLDPILEEQCNRLRHAVCNHPEVRDVRSILVTSAIDGEGKTLVATGLARSFACSLDHSALLVEADLRRPNLARRFSLPPEPGLVGHILDGVPLERTIRQTDIPKLAVACAGGRLDAALDVAGPAAPGETAELAVRRAEIDAARVFFERVAKEDPGSAAVAHGRRLASLAALDGMPARAGGPPPIESPAAAQARDVIAHADQARRGLAGALAALGPIVAEHAALAPERVQIAEQWVELGRLDLAEKELRAILERNPDSVEAHLSLGSIAEMRGDLHRAKVEALSCLLRRPGDLAASQLRAAMAADRGTPILPLVAAAIALGRDRDAAKALLPALAPPVEGDPDPEASFLAAVLATAARDTAGAIRRARLAGPRRSPARAAVLVNALLVAGDRDGAVEAASEAFAAGEVDPLAAALRAYAAEAPIAHAERLADPLDRLLVASQYGFRRPAVRLAGELRQAGGGIEAVPILVARGLEAVGEPDLARKTLEEAAARHPRSVLVLEAYAALLIERGAHAEAAKLLDHALTVAPGDASLEVLAGLAHDGKPLSDLSRHATRTAAASGAGGLGGLGLPGPAEIILHVETLAGPAPRVSVVAGGLSLSGERLFVAAAERRVAGRVAVAKGGRVYVVLESPAPAGGGPPGDSPTVYGLEVTR